MGGDDLHHLESEVLNKFRRQLAKERAARTGRPTPLPRGDPPDRALSPRGKRSNDGRGAHARAR